MALLVVVAVLVGAAVWVDRQANLYYTYQPGTAPRLTTSAQCRLRGGGDLRLADGTPCARLDVPRGRAHVLTGSLLMVDVLVGKSTPAQYLLHELGLLDRFERGAQLVPASSVLGTTPASQLICQDDQEMRDATSAAPVVALQRLGYRVTADYHGAVVTEVVPGTAAARSGLRCNDVVTAVDGHPVRAPADLLGALGARRPGAAVTIDVAAAPAHTTVVHAVLGSRPAADGRPADPNAGFLGIATAPDVTYRLPFDVRIEVGDIGGPSAGLALTLALLDTLSGGALTGGHTVAATGTISVGGAVGDVGGVAQKTVAVERAGAQIFLVPDQEYAVARSHAGSGMKVVAVATLAQALDALAHIGGHIPRPSP